MGKASACHVGDQVQSPGREVPLEKEMQPTPVLLPGESHGGRNLVGYSPGVAKSQTRLSDFTSEFLIFYLKFTVFLIICKTLLLTITNTHLQFRLREFQPTEYIKSYFHSKWHIKCPFVCDSM